MAKTLGEAPITTRSARAKLAEGVHWRGIDTGMHLGYRRGKRGGVWLVRWREGAGYRRANVGIADDHTAADALDFDSAVRAARAVVKKAKTEAQAAADGPPLTVRSAIEAYVAGRDARTSKRQGRQVRSDASQRMSRYVLGQDSGKRLKAVPASPLAAIELHKLREIDLINWRKSLPAGLKASSRQRSVTDVKAALNQIYEQNRHRLSANLLTVIKFGLKAEKLDADDEGIEVARENQILSDGSVGALIRAARDVDEEEGWGGDLFRLVVVLSATGARLSQVARMRVADVQRPERRLLVPASRKGQGGKGGSIGVPVGEDVLDALLPVVTGRPGVAILLEKTRRERAGGIAWEVTGRGPWQFASELLRPWRQVRDRAGLPAVIPYALRHSSIVRGLRAGLPIRLVAALHDTSTAMIEKHYSRWIVDGLDELAARAVVPLVPSIGGNVVSIGKAK